MRKHEYYLNKPGSVWYYIIRKYFGSNVWIGPGAKLFGKIVIGGDTMIGAGAVVNKSFPEGNCRIAGVPEKIIFDEKCIYPKAR